MKEKLTIERTMMALIFSYPIFMLLLKGWLSAVFILLCVLAAVLLFKKNISAPATVFDSTARLVFFTMSSILIATICSQIYNGNFSLANWDSPSRFAVATLVFFALRSHKIQLIQPLQYGLPIGAMAALLLAIITWRMDTSPFGERVTNSFLNPIHFGNLALMLGLLSIASINWFGVDSKKLLLLKLGGFFAGISTSVLSGTRGGWIAIPIILLTWVLVDKTIDRKKIIYGFLLLSLTSVLGYFASSSIQQRAQDTYAEAVSIANGNFDTSFGSRMPIWKGAARIFIENPIVGVGPNGFGVAIAKLGDSGYISKLGAAEGANEVHNQLFASLAKLGTLGLLSYFLIHLVPLFLFIKARKSERFVIKKTALMGMSLVVGFMVFGLTVEMYNLKMVATFYSLSLAVLLALCYNLHHPGPASFNKDSSHV